MASHGGGPRKHGGGAGGSFGGFQGSQNISRSNGQTKIHTPLNGRIPSINNTVTKAEDQYRNTLPLIKAKCMGELPYRPAYGTEGKVVALYSNYFEMKTNPEFVMHRYHIAIVPVAYAPDDPAKNQSGASEAEETAPTGKSLSNIVRLLLECSPYAEHQAYLVTDFASTLLSCQKLTLDVTGWEKSIKYRKATYRLRLEERGTIDTSHLIECLNPAAMVESSAGKEPLLQALNIILGHLAKSSERTTVYGSNRSFAWDQDFAPSSLGTGLVAMKGFYSSVRAATSRIVINVNVTNGPFYQAEPLHRLMDDLVAANNNVWDVPTVEAFLKGLQVDVLYLRGKTNQMGRPISCRRTIFGFAKKGDGIAPNSGVPASSDSQPPPRLSGPWPDHGAGAKNVKFFCTTDGPTPANSAKGQASGGAYISVFDYVKKQYQIELKRVDADDLPVVNVGNREHPTYIPAELCTVVPAQYLRSRLTIGQAQRMEQFAIRMPYENADWIVRQGANTIGLTSQINPKLTRFNITVSPEFITVPGRVLNVPAIQYQAPQPVRPQDGNWNMRNSKFRTGSKLNAWTYLAISMGKDHVKLQQIEMSVARFGAALAKLGIGASKHKPGITIGVGNPPNKKPIEDALKHLSGPGGNNSKLILVVLPSDLALLYNQVKQVGDVKLGIHTVCVIGRKFTEQKEMYFANVAHKVNLKFGGTNHVLHPDRLGIIGKGRTMVVGVDVTHPSPGSSSAAPSVAGMVASVDGQLGQWPATLSIQKSRKEMVTELGSMLESRLEIWRRKHQVYPENLLIFRDGVSEGQYQTVLDEELNSLREACARRYPAKDTAGMLPHITIVIVGKRHHTRFYPTNLTQADRTSNPRNGTVVDRGITETRNWDFFLQSHTALKGTARPAHYYVILNEIFTEAHVTKEHPTVADVLESLTHNLCYLYGRATKAVSICPPAYYADIVCERARRLLSSVFDAPAPGSRPPPGPSGNRASQNLKPAQDKISTGMQKLEIGTPTSGGPGPETSAKKAIAAPVSNTSNQPAKSWAQMATATPKVPITPKVPVTLKGPSGPKTPQGPASVPVPVPVPVPMPVQKKVPAGKGKPAVPKAPAGQAKPAEPKVPDQPKQPTQQEKPSAPTPKQPQDEGLTGDWVTMARDIMIHKNLEDTMFYI